MAYIRETGFFHLWFNSILSHVSFLYSLSHLPRSYNHLILPPQTVQSFNHPTFLPKMQFSTVLSVAAIASVATAASNITTATATEKTTTLVTITSCEDHVCQETVSPALISTATVTVNDVITEYTTWCPIEAAETSVHNATSAAPTTSAKSETSVAAKAETASSESKSTVTKTIQASKTVQVSSLKVQTEASSTHAVASYTGAANKALPAVGALFAGAAALLI